MGIYTTPVEILKMTTPPVTRRAVQGQTRGRGDGGRV
jgi:hypothetical protein